MDNFNQRKKDVLSKVDKSSKQSWDDKILKLCGILNDSEEYYTTSSCAGRVILMKDEDKKGEGLFIFVSHDLIEFDILRGEIDKLALKGGLEASPKLRSSGVKFKLEPPILHVACRTLEDAQVLYDKAKLVGWKKSGLVSFGKNFILELNSTEKLEFPVVSDGAILVGDEFLRDIVKQSNGKLEKGWKKIEELEKSLY